MTNNYIKICRTIDGTEVTPSTPTARQKTLECKVFT